jgi:hypothetical protein
MMGFFFFLLGVGWEGFFCFLPPSSQFVPLKFSKGSQVFQITTRFYPICFAQTSTPFNINYNPRVHIYFYFATRGAKRCFNCGVLHVPKKITNGPMNMALKKIK